MFKFKSKDAKLLFWGINGLLVSILLLSDTETQSLQDMLLESPKGLGFPTWILFVIMFVVAWVLAKFTDRDSNQ